MRGPEASTLAVVCVACTQVARVPVAEVVAGSPWTCPSCGATRSLTEPGLTGAALTGLARQEEPRPVFSESFQPPRSAPAAEPR